MIPIAAIVVTMGTFCPGSTVGKLVNRNKHGANDGRIWLIGFSTAAKETAQRDGT